MNISFNWLKNYVDTSLTAEEISKVLTDIGLEVEGFEKIETIKGGLKGVVVGEVLSTIEMNALIDELFTTEIPSYTPDGKRVFVVLDDQNIDEMFSK